MNSVPVINFHFPYFSVTLELVYFKYMIICLVTDSHLLSCERVRVADMPLVIKINCEEGCVHIGLYG